MHIKLKQAIVNWLIDNRECYRRNAACREEFRQYIYDKNGNYIIGGEEVSNFITNIEEILL